MLTVAGPQTWGDLFICVLPPTILREMTDGAECSGQAVCGQHGLPSTRQGHIFDRMPQRSLLRRCFVLLENELPLWQGFSHCDEIAPGAIHLLLPITSAALLLPLREGLLRDRHPQLSSRKHR